jgi:hypothetical protein
MHIVQALVAIHERYLSSTPDIQRSVAEIYHWSRAAALFNQKLSEPVEPNDRDPLWAAAAMMGTVSFSSIGGSRPEEAWPLRQSRSTDLQWLKFSEGKMAIWHITNPMRLDSIFRPVALDYEVDGLLHAVTSSGIEGAAQMFTKLCDMDESSTVDNNPYHSAVHKISLLLYIDVDRSTVVRFLSFIGHMNPEYRVLLEKKDPRALLLLAYWFAKGCNSVWWVERRAVVECQSICLYLEKEYPAYTELHELLLYPKMQCGLVDFLEM